MGAFRPGACSVNFVFTSSSAASEDEAGYLARLLLLRVALIVHAVCISVMYTARAMWTGGR